MYSVLNREMARKSIQVVKSATSFSDYNIYLLKSQLIYSKGKHQKKKKKEKTTIKWENIFANNLS